MAISDYSSLQTAILAWLNRTGDNDALAQVTTWIQLAEDEIIAELATMPLRQGETSNSSYTISSQTQALPSGFLRARKITITSTSDPHELDYVAPNQMDRMSPSGTTDRPRYYTLEGNQLRFIPSPDSSYTATFSYQALSALSATNTTNWLLTTHPKIYLFASLAEADRYYRDPDAFTADTGIWKGLFSNAFAADGPSATGAALQMRTDNGNP